MKRGAFILFEGCDRCGKSTQVAQLVAALNALGVPTRRQAFPDRTTTLGVIINQYLTNAIEMDDHAAHLLFAANRWELDEQMRRELASGTTLVVDRYSYSGVAFTAAKGIDVDWCKRPEVGLLAPDVIVHLKLDPDEAAKRGGFGGERYEKTDFQKEVAAKFATLEGLGNWRRVDAARSIEDVHADVLQLAKDEVERVQGLPLASITW